MFICRQLMSNDISNANKCNDNELVRPLGNRTRTTCTNSLESVNVNATNTGKPKLPSPGRSKTSTKRLTNSPKKITKKSPPESQFVYTLNTARNRFTERI